MTRKRRSVALDKEVWDGIFFVAYFCAPRTLKAYAEALNDRGLRSPSGQEWNAQKLSHVFKRHGTTAKRFTQRVHTPPPFEPPPTIPEANLRAYRCEVEKYSALTEENGVWLNAIEVTPCKADIVRHPQSGEGQFIREEGLGRLLCSFIDDEAGTIESVVPASEIEVFRHKRTREERQLLEERLAEKWLRPPFE